ncbi:hypothetical protein KJ673_00150 [Patescibacteria group bacterium]|nr:hypothetical protein [Patescibacteria group bacterium]MBU4452685.1 hypothetical protein [Patescibacteria group bacterium]MCG2687325.1 hypothetical protein [Candidatus Parcubacteria bacterium]
MSLAKSIHLYEKIVSKSLSSTLAQKEWWVLAAIAGLVHTGAIFNMLLRTFLYIQPANELTAENLKQLSPFFSWILSYANNLALLNTTHVVAYAFIGILIFALIASFALIAQFILLFIVSKGTREIHWKDIRKQLHHVHILRLFSVNAVMRILFTISIGLTTIILTFAVTDSLALDILQRIGIYAIVIPFTFFVQILGMIMLVQLVKKGTSLGKVFHRAINILRSHWLTAFEFALVIFIINFLTSGALFIILMIIAIVAGIIFEITLSAGSYLLLSFVTFITMLICGALVLVYAGSITTFNYSAWTNLCSHLEKNSHFPALEHALLKLIKR